MVTVALGIAAPDGSETVPVTSPLIAWPNAGARANSSDRRVRARNLNFIQLTSCHTFGACRRAVTQTKSTLGQPHHSPRNSPLECMRYPTFELLITRPN